MDYEDFIAAKAVAAPELGFEPPLAISEMLFPHQRDIVRWACRRGRAAIFAAFGTGKTVVQLEIARQCVAFTSGRALIVLPLGVRQEFVRDAQKLGMPVRFIRRLEECGDDCSVYLTNYETVRDGKLDPRAFDAVLLDEAAILRGFGGTKTFREMMAVCAGDDRRGGERVESAGVRFRFVATATPSPNEFIELLAYSAFLGVMDVGESKTRFFKRNSEKADKLTLHAHKEREFWLWVSSWAVFVTKPSDVDPSYSDAGYVLPELRVHWHELASDHASAGEERDGQRRLVRDSAIGVAAASKEKRASMGARVEKLTALVRSGDGGQLVIWCDLNDEQKAVERAFAGIDVTYSSLAGADDDDEREARLEAWRAGETTAFVSKPSMYGAGVNLQRAHTMVFAGIGFKAADIIQAIHRIHRFGQTSACDVHLIYTDAEREVRRTLERKWAQHNELVAQMTAIVQQYGLGRNAMDEELRRSATADRAEASGERWRLVNNDTVLEARQMPADSVHLIVTSIPFSTQYEYTPSYLDFGHTDSNEHFWAQMDFLTPELLRVLAPGRVCAVHVKDRIVPGGLTGLGFQTVYPFHCDAIRHFQKHGFAFLGQKTIVTDVVRENNQTYRLAYTEQCKDGSRMGVGMSEYLLLFRKPPTDRSNGYADMPVAKDKAEYSLGRWQIDAHGFARSSGNRLLSAEDLTGLSHDRIFKLYRRHSLTEVYDYEHHVALCDALRAKKLLPVTFMLMPPQSWHPDVWTDVTRMRTLNGAQSAAGREGHLCPLQLDIVDRAIVQHSMPGEVVFDPFAGLGTVPMCAVKLKRRGLGVELNPRYFADAVNYCRAAEREASVPTLFDLDAGLARDEQGTEQEHADDLARAVGQ
jgi:DNA modification methylase